MRTIVRMLVLCVSFLVIVATHANAAPLSLDDLFRQARSAVIAPVEWDGIWTTVDSTYTCLGVFQNTSAGADTICGGKDYTPSTGGSGLTITCTGSATPTTIDLTCTGSGPVFTDCDANYTAVFHGDRNGDSYHVVSTIHLTYSGTGLGCSLLPPSCSQLDIWGTRTGPAPPAYCLTPTQRSTWGVLKTRYR
jgi:hypothetical protein